MTFQTSKLPNPVAKKKKKWHHFHALYALRNFTHIYNLGSIQFRVWNTLGILWELYRKNQMDCRFKRDFLIVRSKGNVMYKGIYGLSLILPFWPKFLRVGEGGEEGPICLSTLDPNGQSGPLSGRQKWHFNAYYRIKLKLILMIKMMISVMKIVLFLTIMVMKMTKNRQIPCLLSQNIPLLGTIT